MDKFLSTVSNPVVVIVIAVLVVILGGWLIAQKIRTKKYRTKLEDLEKGYTALKSVPLSLKMNKANAVGRVDAETSEKVNLAKEHFEEIQKGIASLSENLAEAEDAILVGKLQKADSVMSDITADIADSEKKVRDLDSLLDDILAKETAQRQEVTALKNRFRALKSQAQENTTKLSYSWPMIEQRLSETEKMFSTFEEWMYSSDFDKANRELDSIRESLSDIESMLDVLPDLLMDARGVIPSMAETLHHDYTRNRNRGVYLKHLDVEKNLTVLTANLKEDLKKLKAGYPSGVREHLEDYKQRIQQMDDAVKKEGESYDELKRLSRETETLFEVTKANADIVKQQYEGNAERFGMTSMNEDMTKQMEELDRLSETKNVVYENVKNYQIPATKVLSQLKEFNQDLTNCSDEISNMKSTMETATNDEDRARKQLVKLQIIMNQMQVKLRKYKLPNISDSYEADMTKANNYISKLSTLVDETPINMPLLNATLSEALDFIYKLYNNLTNVVATAIMVEDTIVFGNRYRSTYEDIDSELTRSELSFRNGEYTNALTTAIATIEKIHPGNYESMIRENARNASV